VSGSADGLDPKLAQSIAQLEADNKGVGINEGFRTPEQQQQRYDTAVQTHGEAEAGKYAAKPGHSNHEKGLAADLSGYAAVSDETLAKYGLYRPMSYEPWHVELIGGDPGHRADQTHPIPTDVHAVMSTFADMIGGVGPQPYSVGVQGSSVAAQSSGVSGDVTPGAAPMQSSTSGSQILTAISGPGATSNGDLGTFISAISGQESGGNYDATNARTGASGRFQIMPENWPSWSKEAGLGDNAPRTPANQDLVAQFKMQQYFDQFGNWRDVAIAWYGGPGAVNYSEEAKNRKQGNGNEPSINEYADTVMKRMGA
jgi:hypothetical protein